MKLLGALVLSLAGLAGAADASARDEDALVEMHHQIVGPAWKTWSLRLEANGKIIEERWDWSKKRYHSEETRCKLTKVESERVLEASRQLLSALPTMIDRDRPVVLDGPNKELRVRHGSEEHWSYWSSPEDTNLSIEGQAFARSWEKIEALLTCASK